MNSHEGGDQDDMVDEKTTLAGEGGDDDMNELVIVNFVQKQVREDLNSCVDAIYSGSSLDDYFETLLRVQSRLQKWKGFSVQDLYYMLIDKA